MIALITQNHRQHQSKDRVHLLSKFHGWSCCFPRFWYPRIWRKGRVSPHTYIDETNRRSFVQLYLGMMSNAFEKKIAIVTLVCASGLLLHCVFILYLSITFSDEFVIIVLMIVLSEIIPIGSNRYFNVPL